MSEYRDFADPKYKKWRIAVFARDGFACKLCQSKYKIQAHHIRRWADYIELRYVIANGITLCEPCHANVKDREDEYAPQFISLVGKKYKTKKKERDDFLEIQMRLRKK